MCGIVGLMGSYPDRVDAVTKMTEQLTHRGPDEQAVWETYHLTLGHTRLKIVDLSPAAAQPMHRWPFTIIFNGEIYNWRALRADLERLGERFRSNGDTEILLSLYERYGIGMLDRLEGMFAFALWDEDQKILHLVRDRYGVKPLLYAPLPDGVVFGSEPRCFAKLNGVDFRLDREALTAYLATNYVAAPHTIWSGVRRLEPGHRLEVSPGSPPGAQIRWFDPVSTVDAQRVGNPSVARERLREAMSHAVELRLQADVPVGVFLSGGIDSSIVAAVAASRQDKVVTLNVGYESAPAMDERDHARRVAEWLDTEHREILITADQARIAVEEVLARVDEPFADDSLVPTFILARAARREVTVALSGDGGDELFGGYTKHLGSRWAQVPGAARGARLLELITRTVPEGRTNAPGNAVRMLRRFAGAVGADLIQRQRSWIGLLHHDAAEALTRLQSPTHDPVVERLEAEFARTAHWDDEIARVLMADVTHVLPHDMLDKVDRASMWNSLEVRSPFLDRRVLPLAFSFPGDRHVGLLQTKRVLRSVFQDLLPPEIVHRPKRGFGIPLGEWMRGPLAHLLDILSPSELKVTGVLDPLAVRTMVDEHLARRRDRSWELWNLIVLQSWSTRYPWSA